MWLGLPGGLRIFSPVFQGVEQVFIGVWSLLPLSCRLHAWHCQGQVCARSAFSGLAKREILGNLQLCFPKDAAGPALPSVVLAALLSRLLRGPSAQQLGGKALQ